ncbi:baseplate J/gp47 family protein [Paenibacillus wynnii]|uniref:Baseplate J protein n=1 Tax=Paenibacillus wynnii TaxID=268407 RepID=A0A098MG94_9BACL|nr:baseplate J/gp47 family protein [Paenibacillus wynnii]KGE21071.1 baseplate J protein [Paenibacillus wynnii]
MYEDQTFEALLERMLDRVPEGMDKREGSIVYDALAPAAAEMAQMYVELDINQNLMFADTASGDYLDRTIAWSGIIRKQAIAAQLRGVFYSANDALMDIAIGSRYSLDDINYRAIEKLSLGNYRMECESVGLEGGQRFGSMLPIDYVNGLVRAELSELLVPGADRETDSKLRTRYFTTSRKPGTSGNKYHYLEWALQITGVGGAKVYPLWNGPKTVKVVIIDTDSLPASSVLVQQVQDYIDPSPGLGEGQAPIGAVVTVAAATGKFINITATVTLASGYALQDIVNSFDSALETWRKSRVFTTTYVSHAVIGALLLGTDGVLDYTGLLLNGSTVNVALTDEEVPRIGTVNLGV